MQKNDFNFDFLHFFLSDFCFNVMGKIKMALENLKLVKLEVFC